MSLCSAINKIINFFKTNRYLASNYWDCPILDYSSKPDTDYSTLKNQCGKNFLSFDKSRIEKNKY